MRIILNSILFLALTGLISSPALAQYERNKAVPVEKVLFGKIDSVRNISQEELVNDRKNGWKTFGGALIGGVIGNQFGGGSGQDIATVLGAIIGGSIAHNSQNSQRKIIQRIVELMITTSDGKQYMVIQDYDQHMLFQTDDKVRIVYLSNGYVRVDKQL